MAFFGYVLSMPPCKMTLRSSDGSCGNGNYRSCMDVAERNVRLYLSGTIPEQRLAELRRDLADTCPLASVYEAWLLQHASELPIQHYRSLKRTRQERRAAVQAWLRKSCGG